jgi:hypothetical protein
VAAGTRLARVVSMARGYRWLLVGPDPPARSRSKRQKPGSKAGAKPSQAGGSTDAGAAGLSTNEDGIAETRLFTRGNESVLLTVYPSRLTVYVLGPGHTQEMHEFESANAFMEFLEHYEDDALEAGWKKLGVPDRRM